MKESIRTSHARKDLTDGTNFAEPVVAGFFGIKADVASFKILCDTSNTSVMQNFCLQKKKKIYRQFYANLLGFIIKEKQILKIRLNIYCSKAQMLNYI